MEQNPPRATYSDEKNNAHYNLRSKKPVEKKGAEAPRPT
jgi:hypothetical protein